MKENLQRFFFLNCAIQDKNPFFYWYEIPINSHIDKRQSDDLFSHTGIVLHWYDIRAAQPMRDIVTK